MMQMVGAKTVFVFVMIATPSDFLLCRQYYLGTVRC